MNNLTSKLDETIDTAASNIVEKASRTTTGKMMSKQLDSLTKVFPAAKAIGRITPSSTAAGAKSLVAKTKLGLWAFAQPFVQGSAALNVVGYSHIHAVSGMRDLMAAFVPDLIGIGRTAKGTALRKMISDSGFVAGLDFVDLQPIGKGSKLLGSHKLKKLANSHMIPYKAGEGFVRGLAWMAEHNKLLSEIKKGKSAFKMADVGSPKYLAAVSNKAEVPALNMSRMNQPLVARGIAGVPGQFQQFVVHQADIMLFSKETTKLQKLGMLGAWSGGAGMAGVPFLHDSLVAAEWAASKMFGIEAVGFVDSIIDEALNDLDPESQKFWKEFIRNGAISAMTDRKINIANRIGLSRYLTDFINHANPSDLLFGPAYSTIVGLIMDTTNTIKTVPD
ncbi:hypothetical protein THIOSC15_2140004 [uncultured Thiomicrorhabdus sp.]